MRNYTRLKIQEGYNEKETPRIFGADENLNCSFLMILLLKDFLGQTDRRTCGFE